MVLLTDIWHLPMLWWVIVPIGVAFAFCAILVWDSRVPHEKRILKFIKHPLAQGKGPVHADRAGKAA